VQSGIGNFLRASQARPPHVGDMKVEEESAGWSVLQIAALNRAEVGHGAFWRIMSPRAGQTQVIYWFVAVQFSRYPLTGTC
jgi:hypothetical protein